MKKVHESFSAAMMDTRPRLICPTCLSQQETTEGVYYMDTRLSLIGDIHTSRCSTSQHDLSTKVSDSFIDIKDRDQERVSINSNSDHFLDALASLAFKLSVSESVSVTFSDLQFLQSPQSPRLSSISLLLPVINLWMNFPTTVDKCWQMACTGAGRCFQGQRRRIN